MIVTTVMYLGLRSGDLAEQSLSIVSRIQSTSDVCIENIVSETKQMFANEN